MFLKRDLFSCIAISYIYKIIFRIACASICPTHSLPRLKKLSAWALLQYLTKFFFKYFSLSFGEKQSEGEPFSDCYHSLLSKAFVQFKKCVAVNLAIGISHCFEWTISKRFICQRDQSLFFLVKVSFIMIHLSHYSHSDLLLSPNFIRDFYLKGL